MAKTVIGMMENIDEVQAVVRDLVSAGIRREDIGFMANEKHAVPGSAALNESEGQSHAASGEQQAHDYADGVRRVGILVTVAAEDEALAGTAAGIMRQHGARN